MSSGVNGTFVTEIDGVEFYTDGVKHSGTSFTVSIAYVDFAREYDSISSTGAWAVGASSRFPIANVDNTGKVTVDAFPGVFDVGVVRYSDGTLGVHGGASIGGPGMACLFWESVRFSPHPPNYDRFFGLLGVVLCPHVFASGKYLYLVRLYSTVARQNHPCI